MEQVQISEGSSSNMRRPVACLPCRRKKHKCDGLKPVCTRCIKSRRQTVCVYEMSTDHLFAQPAGQSSSAEITNSSNLPNPPLSIATKTTSTESDERVEILALASRYDNIREHDLLPYEGQNWWEMEELPLVLRDYLIAIFVQHSAQFDFHPFLLPFLVRVQTYSPGHPKYPHLSLLNVIYLLAAFCLVPPSHPIHSRMTIRWDVFQQAEAVFLKKTRESLVRNIAMVEDMLDFLIATCLLSRYLYSKGRYEEGHHAIAGAMRLCVACKMHTISSPHILSYFPVSIMPKPSDASEVRDRVNVFWLAFMLDRFGSMCVGVANSLPDEDITTVFPKVSFPPDYDFHTVLSLYDPRCPALNVGGDGIHVMKAKVGALLNQIRRVVIGIKESAKGVSSNPSKFQRDWYSLDKALTRLISSLPTPPPVDDGDIFSRARIARLLDVYLVSNGGMILLHGSFLKTNEESHSKAVAAAQEIVQMTKPLAKIPELYWDMCMNMAWVNACEVLHDEIRRLQDGGLPLKGHELIAIHGRQDLEFLSAICVRLGVLYPDHSKLSISFVQGLLDGLNN